MRGWVVAGAFVVALMGTSNLARADDTTSSRANAAPWVLVGVGSTAGVVGTALEVFALASARPDGPATISVAADSAFSRGPAGNDTRALQGAAIVTMSVGLGAILAGLIWHFAEPRSHVVVSPTLGGLALRATF